MAECEKEVLQKLNYNLDEYIKKIKNQASNQQGYEIESIYVRLEEKMRELWRKVEDNEERTEELKTYKMRLEKEKSRRKKTEDEIEELTAKMIIAELKCEHQKKCNELLRNEIRSLKDIYEKKIHELHRQRKQNLTETDGSEINEMMQMMKKHEKLILGKQKKKMVEIERRFKEMMENLTVYEDNKLDLTSEIEKYRMLLKQMKKRVEMKDSSLQGPNAGINGTATDDEYDESYTEQEVVFRLAGVTTDD